MPSGFFAVESEGGILPTMILSKILPILVELDQLFEVFFGDENIFKKFRRLHR